MTSSRRKLWIFIDWDETITAKDTLSLIAPPDGSTGAPPFRSFGDYYVKIMDEFDRDFGPRNTLERQLEFLDKLKVVEKQSVGNVEKRGLFKGVTEEELCERAKRVMFREGWKEFVEKVKGSKNAELVAVVSVNWSAVFIESVLKNLHGEEFLQGIEIRANVRIYICF
jgi:2-hydroxy-3-keto-5-methylthiopentenyl-1-phosphate phosphatase